MNRLSLIVCGIGDLTCETSWLYNLIADDDSNGFSFPKPYITIIVKYF